MTVLAPLPSGPVRRVAFLGTPEMAVPVLRALVASGVDVGHVITRADKRRGRGADLAPSPVKAAALELGLTVSHKVDDLLDTHDRSPFDLAVVVAYGALIRPHVLERIPMVNLHFSLLPRWRGAAPVERALLAGDTETGVCLMQIEEGLDTGGVIDRTSMAITATTTADGIRHRLVDDGTEMLLRHLRDGLGPVVPQSGDATYAAKIDSAELLIDWTDASAVSRLVRLGGAHTFFRGRRLKVHDVRVIPDSGQASREPGCLVVAKSSVSVATANGIVELVSVQPEGKARMDVASWVNGNRPTDGEMFARG